MTRAPTVDEAELAVLPAPPGRPRSPEADRAIRDATVELLTRDGYANLTMSGVAAAAGVSTATLYRRWSSKLELVVGVLKARAEERPMPNTGSLAGDCRSLLRSLVVALLHEAESFLDSTGRQQRQGYEVLRPRLRHRRAGLLGDLACAVRVLEAGSAGEVDRVEQREADVRDRQRFARPFLLEDLPGAHELCAREVGTHRLPVAAAEEKSMARRFDDQTG